MIALERDSEHRSLMGEMSGSPRDRTNSVVSVSTEGSVDEEAIAKGGVAVPFPWKVHKMLDAVAEEGLEDVVSWQPHGRSFTVHKPKVFVEKIMSRFFSQSKYASFQRQLNLYGFSRFSHGKDKGAYFHYLFIRGKCPLVRGMVRRKIKGTKVRRMMAPSEEPDFYALEWQDENRIGEVMPNSVEDAVKPTITAVAVSPNNSPGNKPVVAPPMPTLLELLSEPVANENWDDLDALIHDGDLLFFEGSPFHYLENDMGDPPLARANPNRMASTGHHLCSV